MSEDLETIRRAISQTVVQVDYEDAEAALARVQARGLQLEEALRANAEEAEAIIQDCRNPHPRILHSAAAIRIRDRALAVSGGRESETGGK